MKRQSDVVIGEKRRVDIDCALIAEFSKRNKPYIKIIGPGLIDEKLTVRQKEILNNQSGRTIRDLKTSMGLTRMFININNGKFILVEYREYGEGYLKAPSELKTIKEVYQFFKDRFFLVVKLDKNEKPVSFSDLTMIECIDKKKWSFDTSNGNKNRINIQDFNKYFVDMHAIDKAKSGLIFNKLILAEQFDYLLS